ncbi:RecX family transcriptional regulator [Altererythrobacter sp. JGD-16]|uniref:Regulatory protein RecX n=1 Tax=Altererythrobacter lutimaris TaxID=2743979 RepID=A0A850H943_9SPHN|nr:RecX family transcriptional regulator [Altererythrobacter lutimaris]
MVSDETNMRSTRKRQRRVAKPLDQTRLRDLALSYAARYATSAAKLESYLQRKIRERGVAEGEELNPRAIVERLVELNYVDDEAYARARSGSLMRRGYGARRVEETLRHSGISQELREEIAPGEYAKREAAIRLAQKRGFGPYAKLAVDPARREKQIAAMARAGHDFGSARFIVEAAREEELDQWLAEAADEEDNTSW